MLLKSYLVNQIIFWKDKNNQSLDKIIEVNKILEKISSGYLRKDISE